MRHIFNERLNTVSQFHEGITVLKLKKIWEPTDSNLFLYESNRFTSEGINAYWAAVDCTIRFMDTIMIQKVTGKVVKKKAIVGKFQENQVKAQRDRGYEYPGRDKYKWQSENYSKTERHYREYDNSHRRVDYDNRSFNGRRENITFTINNDRRRLPEPPKYC